MHDSIVQLRRELHQHPELSGAEAGTARAIAGFFRRLEPDLILEGVGGHGVAIVFRGADPGPTVLLRCELDALPIQEQLEAPHRSGQAGVSHKCGHDGHMAVLAAVGATLATTRPERGRVVLLYQPAEETGEGAAAVMADPRFAELRPDFAFAFHNLPGFPLGQVVVRPGAFTCASRGIVIRLIGSTSHAAQPEAGRSPAIAVSRILQRLSDLPWPLVPPGETAFATVVGAQLGEKAFGTAPGQAEIWATVRSESDQTMQALVRYAEQTATRAAADFGLGVAIHYEDVFPATINGLAATEIVRASAAPDALRVPGSAFRWSEDFGHFTACSEGALFGIGAGTGVPDLHNPDYDFPDELIPVAQEIMLRVVSNCLKA